MSSVKNLSVSDAKTSAASNPKARSGKGMSLSLEAERSGLAMVLHCQSRVVFRNEARQLSSIISDVLPRSHRMIVDLGGVDSVDQGGLGELVLTQLWAEASGYLLLFASPKKAVRHLFEVTHVAPIFDIYPSVAEAMAVMASARA